MGKILLALCAALVAQPVFAAEWCYRPTDLGIFRIPEGSRVIFDGEHLMLMTAKGEGVACMPMSDGVPGDYQCAADFDGPCLNLGIADPLACQFEVSYAPDDTSELWLVPMFSVRSELTFRRCSISGVTSNGVRWQVVEP